MGAAPPIWAAVLLMLGFGSIHAFSLFLVPLEQATGASRGSVSSVYALALGALTAAVLFARLPLAAQPPATLAVAVCLASAFGLAVAASAPPLLLVHLGYGLLFGAANGIAYALCLVVAGNAAPARAGFWIGAITAAYAIGAGIWAAFLGVGIPAIGWQACLVTMAGVFLALGVASGFLLRGLHLPSQVPSKVATATWLPRFWLAYATSVAAGLMVLGHAAAIVERPGGSAALGTVATTLAGLANAAGGLAAGLAAARLQPSQLLAVTSVLSLAGLMLLLTDGAAMAVAGVTLVALAYGAHIAAFPAAIRRAFGAASFAWAYGRVFTAWGAAGIFAPWLAGALYSAERGYALAFVAAGAAAASGLALNATLPTDGGQADLRRLG